MTAKASKPDPQHPSVRDAQKFGSEQVNYVSEAGEDLDGRKCHVCGAAFIRGQENCLSCNTPFGAEQVAPAACPNCGGLDGYHTQPSCLGLTDAYIMPAAVISGDKTQTKENNVRIIKVGLGEIVSNWGVSHGMPALIIEPVTPSGAVGERAPDTDLHPEAIVFEIHNPDGMEILIEDYRTAVAKAAARG